MTNSVMDITRGNLTTFSGNKSNCNKEFFSHRWFNVCLF